MKYTSVAISRCYQAKLLTNFQFSIYIEMLEEAIIESEFS